MLKFVCYKLMQIFYYFSVMAGNRSLPEAMMTMVPEAWQNDTLMPEYKYTFKQYFLRIGYIYVLITTAVCLHL